MMHTAAIPTPGLLARIHRAKKRKKEKEKPVEGKYLLASAYVYNVYVHVPLSLTARKEAVAATVAFTAATERMLLSTSFRVDPRTFSRAYTLY